MAEKQNSSNYLIYLDRHGVTPEIAGGKGAMLARLFQEGYPVPEGFILPPAAFMDDDLKAEAWAQVQAALVEFRKRDKDVSFAVRSSAPGEDSNRASFAGEFETVVGVTTDESIRAAIHTVRQSRKAMRVKAYSQARDAHGEREMAVLVQKLVPAQISGVLFTADPVNCSRQKMVGNFVTGLGEALVSGEAEPNSFSLSRPRGGYAGPPKLKRYARRLFRLGKRLELELGCPQDIEWAVARGRLFLLQARPITTMQGSDPITGEYNDSMSGDYLWSCVNLGEAMAVVMTPLTWSLLKFGFSELDILPGYSMVGNIGGRLYQNVTVNSSVLKALGQNIKQMAKELGGVRDEYLETMDQYLVPVPEANFFNILPSALRVRGKERSGHKNLDVFLGENPDWCRAMVARIQTTHTRAELVQIVSVLKSRTIESFWRNYATALKYGELVGKLRRELKKLVGAETADTLLSNVSRQDKLLASLGPLVGLSRVASGQMSRAAYLEQWGHRSALEIETSVPRPIEDPGWLDRQLEIFNQEPGSVENLLADQRKEFDRAWSRFQDRYPHKVKTVKRRLEKAATAAWQREAARSESVRLIWVARTWILRVGELTGLEDGAFFLTLDELLNYLSGEDSAAVYIPARRQMYARYQALPPYPLLIRGRFDPFRWAADPQRRSDVYDSHGLLPQLTLKPTDENLILGMPGSAGQVEGVVRCLDHPEDGGELLPGEILVTSQTNIGWTFIFPRAAAVVTDVGAPLSHAAIVARELGIPAVVNCGDATQRLNTGDRVRVDGGQGRVEILGRIENA